MNLNAITLAITRPGGVRSWDPLAMFTTGVNGAWYDPSDINLTWRRNLLTYSEQFDNAAWVKSNTTVTANAATAPDGTLTAEKLIPTTSAADHYISSSAAATVPGSVYRITFYAKAAEYSLVSLSINGPYQYPRFNLSTGIATSDSGFSDVSMSLISNGWYRCSATFSAVISAHQIYFYPGTRLAAGDGTSGIYIWGAQLELGSTATPYQRITDGVQDYLQYQAQPVLYQDAAGTTPVTAVEQPVGLMLDKSKGLVLGPELVTNGDFSQGTTGWSVSGTGAQISVAGGVATVANGSANEASLLLPALTAGKWYFLSADISAVNGTSSIYFVPPSGSQISNIPKTTAGKLQGYFYSGTTGAGSRIAVGNATAGAYFSIDNISVRELPGNHAFNSSGNSANFSVLSARYNLATETEFRNGLTDAPVRGGLITATTLIGYSGAIAFGHDGSTTSYAYKIQTLAGSMQYTMRIIVQMTDGNPPLFPSSTIVSSNNDFGFVVGSDTPNPSTATVSSLGSGVYLISIGYTTPSTPFGDSFGIVKYNTNSSRTFKVTAYDLRVANDALNQPTYQRVNTATDYDTAGFKPYLKFNGTNQWLQTNSIDFTYGDKMFVSAGTRNLSSGDQLIVSFGPYTTNNGAFALWVRDTGDGRSNFLSKGTSVSQAWMSLGQAASYLPPITVVSTGLGDISGDRSTLRLNGLQVVQSTADQGTGNYEALPLYIGTLSGSAQWFSGRLYQMVVAGKQASASEISQTEAFINQKTGAY